jgi:dCTP deaminase
LTVLNDIWIRKLGKELLINPYNPEQVNPASYDLCLDSKYIDLNTGDTVNWKELHIKPGEAYLASTIEYVKFPNNISGVLYLKSSLARLGLDHALAGWIDPGFEGNLTLELHSHRPITLYAGQRIVQVVFYLLTAPSENPYSGKYKGQKGPTEAK